MIGSLLVPISERFGLINQQWGLINSGVLFVAIVLYPIWGFLYDRFAGAKLLSPSSSIWGVMKWMNAIVQRFGVSLATGVSTRINDSSNPELWILVADSYRPTLAARFIAFSICHNNFLEAVRLRAGENVFLGPNKNAK